MLLRRTSCPAGHRRCQRPSSGPGLATGRRSAVVAAAAAAPKVVLTREHGKNDKLLQALAKHGFQCIEMPLIEHADGPDRAKLPDMLRSRAHDWVTVTSPEAASVFLDAWRQAGSPQELRVAVVGGGTGEILEKGGLKPAYVSSKALGKTLGGELPKVPGGNNRVLYPASAKASDDLQGSLEASGFSVERLDTYNTMAVSHVAPEVLAEALGADVVTYGSPSAVKAWVSLAGLKVANAKVNACIGSTSARACASAGITQHVYFPDSPGIEGWVESIVKGCQERQLQPAPASVATA